MFDCVPTPEYINKPGSYIIRHETTGFEWVLKWVVDKTHQQSGMWMDKKGIRIPPSILGFCKYVFVGPVETRATSENKAEDFQDRIKQLEIQISRQSAEITRLRKKIGEISEMCFYAVNPKDN